MDLKQQLVIWKRAEYLVKNVALTPKLCDLLVDYDLFTCEMMAKVQTPKLNVEKTLMALMLLGSHGDQVYEKFLRALSETNFIHVVHELRRTEKSTKFGEMLPPVFTYFQDLSEFLRQNVHISMRLSEADKHALQSYIDGKLVMQNLTTLEKLDRVNKECERLTDVIAQQNNELKAKSGQLQETVEKLESVRRELTLGLNQYDDLLLSTKTERAESLLYRQLRLDVGRVEALIRSEYHQNPLLSATASQLAAPQPRLRVSLAAADNSVTNTNARVASGLVRAKSSMKSSDLRTRQIRAALTTKLALLKSRDRMLNDKLYGLQSHREQVEKELELLVTTKSSSTTVTSPGVGNPVDVSAALSSTEMKTVAADATFEMRKITDQMGDVQTAINRTRAEIEAIKTDLATKADDGQHSQELHKDPDVESKLRSLLAAIRTAQTDKAAADLAAHETELEGVRQKAESDRLAFEELVAGLRYRLRGKMQDVHRRDMVLRKLRKQLNVISRYHAYNMNAQVSADECRKIVRDIIRDAREVLITQDRWEQEILGKGKGDDKDDDEDDENAAENSGDFIEVSASKRKKKSRSKLDNELLRLIADKLHESDAPKQTQTPQQQTPATSADAANQQSETAPAAAEVPTTPLWRQLGNKLDLTDNRLDLVELDASAVAVAVKRIIDDGLEPPNPADRLDLPGYAMLRVWRDEESPGQPDVLYNALKEIGRDDLARIVASIVVGVGAMTTTSTAAVAATTSGEGPAAGSLRSTELPPVRAAAGGAGAKNSTATMGQPGSGGGGPGPGPAGATRSRLSPPRPVNAPRGQIVRAR